MKWSSVLFVILIVVVSGSRSKAEIKVLSRYVIPNRTTRCFNDQVPCQTIEEFVSQADVYFTNNTNFYFQPGNHRLNRSLILTGLRNIIFHGLPDNNMVNVLFGSFVSITWENCWFVQLTSISFILPDNYTFSILFKHTELVQLYNVSVIGEGYNPFTGCSAILSYQSGIGISGCKFIGIQGLLGAAIMVSESSVSTTGNNTFFDSAAASGGGSIYLFNTTLTLNGTNLFMNNSVHNNGYIDKYWFQLCNYSAVIKNFEMGQYQYTGGGGAISCSNCTLIINGYSTFTRNVAEYGGAIAAQNGRISIHDTTFFCNNFAFLGGAMYLGDVNLNFYGNISLEHNSATLGGALHMSNTNISFNMNKAASIASEILVTRLSTMVVFQQNTASHIGGAIEGHDKSILNFTGIVIFIANSALNGGAIGSFESSYIKMILVPILNITFLKNHANNSGGALYFENSQCSIAPLIQECFISILNHTSYPNVTLVFRHNTAGITGSTLYGDHLSECRLCYRTSESDTKSNNDYCTDALDMFMNISKIIPLNKSVASISSSAKQIQFCTNSVKIFEPWVGKWMFSNAHSFGVYPGQRFNITLKAIDQVGSPVPANILIDNLSNKHRLHPLSQNVTASCTNVYYWLYSSEEEQVVSFRLYLKNACQNLIRGNQLWILSIRIQKCPVGFEIAKGDDKCTCSKNIQKLTQKCHIDNCSFERIRNSFWISMTNNTELIVYDSRCPLDYCKENSVYVTLSDPSIQCDFNRTGTLCGQCQKNFSLALSSLHCIPCNNKHTTLVLFFILAGIALIAVIFLLRLTVAVGTLNGLFIYANIIQANQQAFLPRAINSLFTIFISWVNLDLGVETCFYDGMDIYGYSWFQFLFPIYVWFLVGSIILACHYSQSIAERLGRNPVAVLATLLLMSYSKILQAIIVPLSSTHLTYYSSSYDSKSHQTIWLYDGSIGFFKEPKHIALGLFSILSLMIFVVPYISLLLFGHWLQGCSNWRILSWLNKLKPFMDAYHAPYKKHTRYWTGLLLLSRLGLFLTFAIHVTGSESVNLLAVSSVCLALLTIKLLRVYENIYKDILESSFILNLGIFSMATFYLKEESKDDRSQLILSSISVGIAFITFIGILLFHMSIVLKSSTIWKVHMLPFIQKSLLLSKILRITPVIKDKDIKGDKETAELQALPTSTEIDVDLREPLLEVTESQAAA